MGSIISKHSHAISTQDASPIPPDASSPADLGPALPASCKVATTPLKYPPGSPTQAALLKSVPFSSSASLGPGKVLTVLKKLDEGAEGNVFLVRDETGALFAAKLFKGNSNEANLFEELGNGSSGWLKTYGLRSVYQSENDTKPVQALISEYINGVNLENYSALLHASSLPDSEEYRTSRY